MSNNQEKLDKVVQDCEQLRMSFETLKTAVDGIIDLSGRLEKLAEIQEHLNKHAAIRRDKELL